VLAVLIPKAARKAVVFGFRCDFNEPGKSLERRSCLTEFHMDRTHTEKARELLEVTVVYL